LKKRGNLLDNKPLFACYGELCNQRGVWGDLKYKFGDSIEFRINKKTS